MKNLPLKSTISTLLIAFMLAACGSQDGYYDTNGNWIAPPNATTEAQRNHSPDPGMIRYHNHDDYPVVQYDRAGYYDYNGNYVTADERMSVPSDMFPPRGMCRVWLPNRVPEHQPRVESCDGIQYRVPAGAYVIYGG